MKHGRNRVVTGLILLILVSTGVLAIVIIGHGGAKHQMASATERGAGLSAGVEVFSLAEAEAKLGTSIPLPAYLPPGCQAQRLYVCGPMVQIYFSDKPITNPPDAYRTLPNRWQKDFERPDGPKLVLEITKGSETPSPTFWESVAPDNPSAPGEVVQLGAVKGMLTDWTRVPPPEIDEHLPEDVQEALQDQQVDDVWMLRWWHSDFSFLLKAPKDPS